MEITPASKTAIRRYGKPKYAGMSMAKDDFLQWESDDNYIYEYNEGILEPTSSMKQDEMEVLNALEDKFFLTKTFREGSRLRAEVDVWISSKQMRRPDVSLFSKVQFEAVKKGQNVIPTFLAEFVSENDDTRKYIKKLNEYFQAGVQVVWLVFPDDYTVYVYTSPKTVTICMDDDVLSASPALPELQLTVNELFKR